MEKSKNDQYIYDLSSHAGDQELFQNANDQINLLRQRTFTPELKELVEKITRHEQTTPQVYSRKSESLSSKELFTRLHRLYYQTRFIDQIDGLTLSFRPINTKLTWIQPEKSARIYLQNILKKNGIHEFALLDYDYYEEAYRAGTTTMRSVNRSSLVIPVHSGLFTEIKRHPEGLLMSSDLLGDHLMIRSSEFEEQQDQKSYYWFQDLSPLIKALMLSYNQGADQHSAVMPSILIMKIPRALYNEESPAKRIPDLLKGPCAIPLFILNKPLTGFPSDSDQNQFASMIRSLRLCYRLCAFDLNKEMVFVNLRSSQNRKNLLIMNYLREQLRNQLKPDSLCIILNPWRYLVLADRSVTRSVESKLIENNFFSSDALEVRVFTTEFYKSFDEFFVDMYV